MKRELLSDESDISDYDHKEREELIKEFSKMPVEFFSKLRHFQPQIGCLNACSICSKYAGSNVSFWKENRIRNVIATLKYCTPHSEKPFIVWDRDNHISGVVFSYLDNDVGNYYYLDKFIKIAYKELGVKTRVSTVGFSRHNERLNKMHRTISRNSKYLGGVRLSFTPYGIGWCSNNNKFNKQEYEQDIANFLKIYKTYYKAIGSGSRKFCIELRFKPLVINKDVYIFENKNQFIIYSNKYLYVSINKNIKFEETEISDPYNHRLSLNNEGEQFNKIKVEKVLKSKQEIIDYIDNNSNKIEKKVTIYKVVNKDGEYYAVNPKLTDTGNKGMYFYPITATRKKSGYIITERFFLNALFEYKKEHNIDDTRIIKWRDVQNVIDKIKDIANYYQNNDEKERANYIETELLPMINSYVNALKIAKYPPRVFFDKNFTIDTGIICNLGRAIHEFKGLVSVENEPLTLNHERNYGNKNSTMTKEGVAWRLSCGYHDKLIIEELNLSNTATQKGQVEFNKTIQLKESDEVLSISQLKNEYLIPGQKL